MLYLFNMVWPCTCVRKVWLFRFFRFFGSFVHCLWSRHDVGRIWKRFRPVRGRCHVHLAEHSTRSVVLLNVSLHRADESQVARNSCPRLPQLILGLVFIMSRIQPPLITRGPRGAPRGPGAMRGGCIRRLC